jgi:hypothetical protein
VAPRRRPRPAAQEMAAREMVAREMVAHEIAAQEMLAAPICSASAEDSHSANVIRPRVTGPDGS